MIAGITRPLTRGKLIRNLPLGCSRALLSSISAASSSDRIRRHRSRNSDPSNVRAILRVLRWNRRTPSFSSSRPILLPTPEEEIPSRFPASVKLRVSATNTNSEMLPSDSKGCPHCGHQRPICSDCRPVFVCGGKP